MSLVLVISSQIAASRVGSIASIEALHARRVDTLLVPTTLFGRHPGYGVPGGGPIDAETMEGMLGGIAAQNMFGQIDGILTGYFATAEQIAIAAGAIDAIRQHNPQCFVFVDPIMGDEPKGRYVPEEVALAIARALIPRADIISPNVFELEFLSGQKVTDWRTAVPACRSIECAVLATGIRTQGQIGAVYCDEADAFAAVTDEIDLTLRGAGDLLAGVALAAILEGAPRPEIVRRAVAVTASMAVCAKNFDRVELPLVTAREHLLTPAVQPQLMRL